MCYEYWKDKLFNISFPVFHGFANKTIKNTFIKQTLKTKAGNEIFIELFCRTFLGVSPWISSVDINDKKNILLNLVLKSFEVCFDEDYIEWSCGDQLLVEMANLGLGFLRFPKIWNLIKYETKKNILKIFKEANKFEPHLNNWILFKCIVRIFLHKNKCIQHITDIKLVLNDFEKKYYVGDSWYKDGKNFHMDFYNSYVILPFLLDIYKELDMIQQYNVILQRIQRHSEFLERLINSDGTFPIFGRSAVYRTAIFHALVYMCYLEKLPISLTYGQVRCALTQVIKNVFENKHNFQHNFLNLGFSNYQPEIADIYSNSGSVYFSLLIFLPLGKKNSKFWTDKDNDWTQKKLWNCDSIHRDVFLKE